MSVLPRLHCMDEPLELHGDWSAGNAQFLILYWNACNSAKGKTCKSEAEIKQWLKGKQLVLAHNKNVFINNGFKNNTVQKYS